MKRGDICLQKNGCCSLFADVSLGVNSDPLLILIEGHLESIMCGFKERIVEDDRSKIGIYFIRNLVNGKMYIGSTDRNFRKRLREHINELEKDIHFNSHLQNSWNKYKKQNFITGIVEYIDRIEGKEKLIEILNEREGFYIEKYETWKPEKGYNKIRSVDRKHIITQDIRDKMSDSQKKRLENSENHPAYGTHLSEETKDKIRNGNLGKQVGEDNPAKRPEVREKIRQSKLGSLNPNYGKSLSEETKEKMSIARKGKPAWNKDRTGVYSEESLEKMRTSQRAIAKDRSGEKSLTAKLTWIQVKMIRYLFSTGKYSKMKLTRVFEVSHTTISNIVAFRTWNIE